MSKREQTIFRIIEEYRKRNINRKEAAELMGVSERTVARRTKKVREKGLEGVKHGNYGRTPSNKIAQSLKDRMLDLAKRLYFDFNIAHCLEMIELHHEIKEVSYSTFYSWCRKEGLGKRKKRRPSKVHIYRERSANEGLMLQMDGSPEKWNGKDIWSLIALIDDATSKIPAAKFYPTETTWACLKVLRECIEKNGIPKIIYTDEAGWAGGSGKRGGFSQFKRACEELGILLITTPSPEAKGRIERLWATCQDRLIPEFRLYNIKSMTDANRYLDQVFLPAYWHERNVVEPISDTTRYKPVPPHIRLEEVFCIKDTRFVRSDHTVMYKGISYKITDKQYGSLRGKKVSVHQYENDSIGIFYGHLSLEFKKIKPPIRKWERRWG